MVVAHDAIVRISQAVPYGFSMFIYPRQRQKISAYGEQMKLILPELAHTAGARNLL